MRIEDLEDIFKNNAIKAREINQELLGTFMENNPGQPIPEHFMNSFCVNTALATMCNAIVSLMGENDQQAN